MASALPRLRPIVLAAGLLFAGGVIDAVAENIAGRAEIVDGDTLRIEGLPQRIRLFGIDAPESGQICTDAQGARFLCGGRAAQALADLIGRNGRVTCRRIGRDRYARIVARCSIGRKSLSRELVRLGWAVEDKRYSRGIFTRAESAARKAKRGLWAGSFELPRDWRGH